MTKHDYEAEKRLMSHHLERAKALAKNIPRLRVHALTDAHWLSLASLHKAIAEGKTDNSKTLDAQFIEAVQRLEKFVPKLFRPELQEPKLPTPPKNPLTGEIIGLPDSMTERALMKRRYPDWYDYCERMAKSPMTFLAELDEARAKFAIQKAFFEGYDHSANPFTTDDHAKQASIARTDPVRAELLMEEAKPAAALPFDSTSPSYTTLAKIAKEIPQLHEVAVAAKEIGAGWANLEQAQAEASVRELVATARSMGFELHEATGKPRARRPMKNDAPFGSDLQAQRQHEAVVARASDGETVLSGSAHERARLAALKKVGVQQRQNKR